MNTPNNFESPDDDVLEKAHKIAREKYPNASAYKHAAFANSVQTLITVESGGFGGPSIREYAAIKMYGDRTLSFQEACELLLDPNGPIFGPLTQIHRDCLDEDPSFDDDPQDISDLENWQQFN